VYGQSALFEWFLRFHKQPLTPPHSTSLAPDAAFLAWLSLSAQTQPPMGAISQFKTSHFERQEIYLRRLFSGVGRERSRRWQISSKWWTFNA
jgi:hypothetical protein